MKGKAFINEKFPVCSSPPTLLLAGNRLRVLTHNILWQMLEQASIRRPMYTTVLLLFWNRSCGDIYQLNIFHLGGLLPSSVENHPVSWLAKPCQTLLGLFLPPLLSRMLRNAEIQWVCGTYEQARKGHFHFTAQTGVSLWDTGSPV